MSPNVGDIVIIKVYGQPPYPKRARGVVLKRWINLEYQMFEYEIEVIKGRYGIRYQRLSDSVFPMWYETEEFYVGH